jgi:membrane-bound lytic murein transglycosylase B
VQSRLSLLQNRLENQAAATQRQQFTVKKLRAGVQTGAVEPATLQRAERILQVPAPVMSCV